MARGAKRPTTGPASRFEWRTPPLWGFRDSGPYLHDGRAETLDQAVALHGGEAALITPKFFRLSATERRQVEAFLKSLTAARRRLELLAQASEATQQRRLVKPCPRMHALVLLSQPRSGVRYVPPK